MLDFQKLIVQHIRCGFRPPMAPGTAQPLPPPASACASPACVCGRSAGSAGLCCACRPACITLPLILCWGMRLLPRQHPCLCHRLHHLAMTPGLSVVTGDDAGSVDSASSVSFVSVLPMALRLALSHTIIAATSCMRPCRLTLASCPRWATCGVEGAMLHFRLRGAPGLSSFPPPRFWTTARLARSPVCVPLVPSSLSLDLCGRLQTGLCLTCSLVSLVQA